MGPLFFAQTPDATGSLLEYGALGIVVIFAVGAVRVLFARLSASADAERARADRHEEELRKLNTAIQERYLVQLAETTRVIAEVLAQIREDRR